MHYNERDEEENDETKFTKILKRKSCQKIRSKNSFFFKFYFSKKEIKWLR